MSLLFRLFVFLLIGFGLLMAAGFIWQQKMIYFPDREKLTQDQLHAAGLYAMNQIERQPEPIALIFKDLKAEFLKRAEGDVYFYCRKGTEIARLVAAAAHSGERVEMPVHVDAAVPGLSKDLVAKFSLTLSLKKKTP